jgi:hypothetical protein
MIARLAAAIAVLAGTPVSGHRLDEYLQQTIVSIEKGRLEAQMYLTPGVAVFPVLQAYIDTDADGVISEGERRAYAERVLRDLSVSIDGLRLTPELASVRFPTMEEMKEGRGEIELDFHAELPPGGRDRELTVENRHLSRIAAYQVNCLVPRDPEIRIAAQRRNYGQSWYRLEYTQADVGLWRAGGLVWVSPIGLLVFLRLAWLRASRGRAAER